MQNGTDYGYKLGTGRFVCLYWFWCDRLSYLRFTGISLGPLFIGFVCETR